MAQNASEGIGAHLERLGKTDMATFSYEEWLEFIHVVAKEYYSAPPF